MTTVDNLPIEQVKPHPRNVRHDHGDLTELVASITGIGILQPITVAPDGEDWVVIAGHRRHAAAIEAGLASVPCIVRADLDTIAKQLEAMLVENLQRSDLTVMEEADAYQQLELLGATEVSIAKATGRSRGTVRQRLALAGLPTARREQYEKGSLSLDGAVKCARLRDKWVDDEEILAAIDSAGTYDFGNSYYGIDKRIERILEDRKPKPEPDEEPDGDKLDVDGQRVAWEAQQQERNARYEARRVAVRRMYDWLSGRIATKDDVVARALVALAMEDLVDEYNLDNALPIVGIEPCGEDEDVDDANQRIVAAAKALSGTDQMVLLALAVTRVDDLNPYNYNGHVEKVQQLGYTLTKADKACMDVQS